MQTKVALRLGILVLLVGMFVFWAGRDMNISPDNELPEQLLFTVYETTTKILSEKTISKDDPVYQRLSKVLAEEQEGWSNYFYAAYGPGPYVFSTKTMDINCFPNLIVFSVYEKKRGYSVEKEIPNLYQRLGLPEVDIKEYDKRSRQKN